MKTFILLFIFLFQIKSQAVCILFFWANLGQGCAIGFHKEGSKCFSDTRSCLISNGSGSQTWNKPLKSWNVCSLVSCNSGYTNVSGSCTAQICSPNSATSCAIANGAGSRICNSNGTAYGSCNVISCNSGSTSNGSACIDNCLTTNTVGPTCVDGSLFAGQYSSGGKTYRYSITSVNIASDIAWGTTPNTDWVATSSLAGAGPTNMQTIKNKGITKYPAFNACAGGTYDGHYGPTNTIEYLHGKTDWFIPTLGDLYLIKANPYIGYRIIFSYNKSIWTSSSSANENAWAYGTSDTDIPINYRASIFCLRFIVAPY